jgi:hypothetical protein
MRHGCDRVALDAISSRHGKAAALARAVGALNRHLFGHEDVVPRTPDVSAASLRETLERLLRDEPAWRSTLTRPVGGVQTMARSAMPRLSEQLANRLKTLSGTDAMQASRTS